MGKRGKRTTLKRAAVSKSVPVHDKKERTWIIRPGAGTHPQRRSIALGALLRDVLGIVETKRESRLLLAARKVQVDGKVRTDEKYPVGFQDVVSLPEAELYYRITITAKGRLKPVEATSADAGEKLLKVTRKDVNRKGRVAVTFHDGRNVLADNNVRVGDSVRFSLREGKIAQLMKFGVNAKCLITDGKHAGLEAEIMKLFPSKGERPAEALVKTGGGEFRTLAQYLFVTGE